MRKAYPWAIPTWHALLRRRLSVPTATMRSQKKKKTNKKKPPPPTWGQQYKDPGGSGSLGGLHRFARTHRQRVQRLRPHLKELAYTLHKPVRRRFPTLRVQVWGMDHQWVADLVEVQRLAKHNGGTRYLLTVLDVLSKYAWVEPLKDKTGWSLAQAWERLLKRHASASSASIANGSRQRILQSPISTGLEKTHHSPLFHLRGYQSLDHRTVQPQPQRTLVSLFDRRQHLEVRGHAPPGGARVQHQLALQHRAGAPRCHAPQRIGGVAPLVSPTLVTPTLAKVEGRRPGPFEQRGAPLSRVD